MPRFLSNKNWLSSSTPSPSTSTRSVQYADGPDAFTDAAGLPMLVFVPWLLAFGLGAGFAAIAVTVGATCTFGVVIGPGGACAPDTAITTAAIIPNTAASFFIAPLRSHRRLPCPQHHAMPLPFIQT